MVMRTTVRLDDQLLKEAKLRAAASGKTMSEVLEEAIRRGFTTTEPLPARRYLKLRSFKGTGTMPGVDIYDSAALLDILDAPDAPS